MPFARAEEEIVSSQTHVGYPEDNFRCPEIRDPRVQDLYFDTCRKLQMEPMYSHLEQTKVSDFQLRSESRLQSWLI